MKPSGLLWLALTLLVSACSPQPAQDERLWTDTDPPVNATHIFLGEINRSGKPTGFHARPGGEDPANARVARINAGPNRVGVYTAEVEVFDPEDRVWKSKFSTLFPDQLNHGEVVQAILHAWHHRESGADAPWRGPSGLGFEIQGYTLDDGRINTAYPVYVRNRNP